MGIKGLLVCASPPAGLPGFISCLIQVNAETHPDMTEILLTLS